MKLARRHLGGMLAAAGLLFAAHAAQAQSELAHIMSSKEIRIAIPTDFPPYGFVGVNMQPQGLDVEMAKYVASKLGVKAVLVPVTTANRIPYLQTGKVDLVISTLGRTPDRQKVIDFTSAYSPFFIAVFGPKSMLVKGPANMAGKSIAVTRGSVDDTELTKVAPPTTEIRRFEDNNGTIAAYIAHQTQLVATSTQVADVMMKRNPQLHTEFKFVLKNSPNFVGVAKGHDTLKAKINQIIAAAKTDGYLTKLSVKWLGAPPGNLPE